MKITKQQEPESFQPVTFSITLVTKKELQAFKDIFSNQTTSGLVNTSLSNKKNCRDDENCAIVAHDFLQELNKQF